MKEFTVSAAEEGQRFEKYIRRKLPEAGTGFIYRMLRKKNITLNGKKADGKETVREKDRVSFFFSDETFAKFAGTDGTGKRQELLDERIPAYERAYEELERRCHIAPVYESGDILVADKPAGVLSQKAGPEDLSLNEWFVGYLLQKGEVTRQSLMEYVPSVANRLDRNTAGLVLCAKTLKGSRVLSEGLKERTIHKYYTMVVKGRVEEKGEIRAWLTKDSGTNQVRVLDHRTEGAALTRTVYEPVQVRADGTLTLLSAELVTGKTHQLRAHLAFLGHPILGDPKYGDPALNAAYRKKGVRSQLLYCARVELPDGTIVRGKVPAVFGEVMH